MREIKNRMPISSLCRVSAQLVHCILERSGLSLSRGGESVDKLRMNFPNWVLKHQREVLWSDELWKLLYGSLMEYGSHPS